MTTELHVLRRGQGPEILFLHGIGASATAWEAQIERLSPHYACLAPDLPGYGQSRNAAVDDLYAIATALLPELGHEPAHVVGVSFGALVALALAHRHPERCRSLVLADATLGRATMPDAERQVWLSKRLMLAETLQQRSRERAREIVAPNASEEVIDAIAYHMRRARPEGYSRVARIIAATDATPWLSMIRQPALVLCGEHDTVTGKRVSEQLLSGLPCARWQGIADAGHAPHIEQPDLFANAVKGFLTSLPLTTATPCRPSTGPSPPS